MASALATSAAQSKKLFEPASLILPQLRQTPFLCQAKSPNKELGRYFMRNKTKQSVLVEDDEVFFPNQCI
jgi:hypothetical protein